VVTEDLQAGAHDEHEQQQIEPVLYTDPQRKPGVSQRVRRSDGPWMVDDEALYRGRAPQSLRRRDRHDEQHEADRQQPQQVEPAVPPDPHPWRNALRLRHGAGPGGGIDGVLADRQL